MVRVKKTFQVSFVAKTQKSDLALIMSVDCKNLERILQYKYLGAWVNKPGTQPKRKNPDWNGPKDFHENENTTVLPKN